MDKTKVYEDMEFLTREMDKTITDYERSVAQSEKLRAELEREESRILSTAIAAGEIDGRNAQARDIQMRRALSRNTDYIILVAENVTATAEVTANKARVALALKRVGLMEAIYGAKADV